MISKATIGLLLLLLAGLIATGSIALYYRGNAVDYKAQRDKAAGALQLAKDTIDDMKVRQRNVAALDAKYMKELANADAENVALQCKLDRGGRVLVAGKCPRQTAISASVGDATTVELSNIAGRNVLGIRAGIKIDQAKIAVLQEYISEQCVK